jgi:hypothetical protein
METKQFKKVLNEVFWEKDFRKKALTIIRTVQIAYV